MVIKELIKSNKLLNSKLDEALEDIEKLKLENKSKV